MKMNKSKISMAIGAVLGATCFAPAISYGVAFDVLNDKVADNDAGDALLFPFYTTAGSDNEATTSFSVTNTSKETVAVKIRFREQKVSYDALDFIAVLSPYDKFDFWVAQGNNGRPVAEWDDNTCVVGPAPGATSQEFVNPADYNLPPSETGVKDADLAVGHLEVLGVAALNKNTACVTTAGVPIEGVADTINACSTLTGIKLAAAAKHANGEPANCQAVMDFFSSPENVAKANDLSGGAATGLSGDSFANQNFFQDVPNALTGRYLVTIPGKGIEGGEKAAAIQNSNLTTIKGNYGTGGVNLGLNPTYVTAQSERSCEDNSTASNVAGNCYNAAYAWDKQEFAHPHLGDMYRLGALQGMMNAVPAGVNNGGLSGDWSRNPGNHVTVNWIVSLPNKYAYLDLVPASECGGTGAAKVWCLLDNTRSGLGNEGAFKVQQVRTCTDTNSGICEAPTDTGTTVAVDTSDVTVVNGVVTGGTINLGGDIGTVNIANGGTVTIDTGAETPQTFTVVVVNNVPVLQTNIQVVNPTTGQTETVTVTVIGSQTGLADNGVVQPSLQQTTVVNSAGETVVVDLPVPEVTNGQVDIVLSNMDVVDAQGVHHSIPSTTSIPVEDISGGIATITVDGVSVEVAVDLEGDGDIVKKNANGKIIGVINHVTNSANKPFHGNNNRAAPELRDTQDLCIQSSISIWGKDEQQATSYTVSPNGGSSIKLCNEVNVIGFAIAGDTGDQLTSLIQTDANYSVVKLPAVDEDNRGWAYLPISTTDSVEGLNFTLRATEDVTQNNGTITGLNKIAKP